MRTLGRGSSCCVNVSGCHCAAIVPSLRLTDKRDEPLAAIRYDGSDEIAATTWNGWCMAQLYKINSAWQSWVLKLNGDWFRNKTLQTVSEKGCSALFRLGAHPNSLIVWRKTTKFKASSNTALITFLPEKSLLSTSKNMGGKSATKAGYFDVRNWSVLNRTHVLILHRNSRVSLRHTSQC